MKLLNERHLESSPCNVFQFIVDRFNPCPFPGNILSATLTSEFPILFFYLGDRLYATKEQVFKQCLSVNARPREKLDFNIPKEGFYKHYL